MEYYKNSIPIKNIYYMLAYAFKDINSDSIKNVEIEDFDNIYELMAEIIIRGVSYLIKKGLTKSYEEYSDELLTLKGQIDITQTIKKASLVRKKAVCNFDEYTENTFLNQILKSVILLLIKEDIKLYQKTTLKRLIKFFSNISLIDLRRIRWSCINYNRNNKQYRLLINICRLICENMIHTTEDGNVRLMDFSEKTMHRLYEKFILNYYIRHFNSLNPRSAKIEWNIKDNYDETLLPKMQSDIMLSKNNKTLIIDAKFYTKTLARNQYKTIYHSANIYQIYTYVKNYAENTERKVKGMLLYAKTDEEDFKEGSFNIGGNDIYIKNLDLGETFENIKGQLDKIVYEYLDD
ncbi:MAG: 5-methylcytosine-specific restriction endonuclease system specificity protein McrC [Lachnospirales bacterium]